MLNVKKFDVPPPGAGLKTVILATPLLIMFAAGTAARSCPPGGGELYPFCHTIGNTVL